MRMYCQHNRDASAAQTPSISDPQQPQDKGEWQKTIYRTQLNMFFLSLPFRKAIPRELRIVYRRGSGWCSVIMQPDVVVMEEQVPFILEIQRIANSLITFSAFQSMLGFCVTEQARAKRTSVHFIRTWLSFSLCQRVTSLSGLVVNLHAVCTTVHNHNMCLSASDLMLELIDV